MPRSLRKRRSRQKKSVTRRSSPVRYRALPADNIAVQLEDNKTVVRYNDKLYLVDNTQKMEDVIAALLSFPSFYNSINLSRPFWVYEYSNGSIGTAFMPTETLKDHRQGSVVNLTILNKAKRENEAGYQFYKESK